MTPEAFDLTGRVALITGAGSESGIGFAAARLLAQLGCSIAVCATTDRVRERARELAAGGTAATSHIGDLTDEADASRIVAEATAEHGAVDILVNNAGMVSIGGGFEQGALIDMDYATWRGGLARNLDTAFLVTRAALPGMVDRRWGRIVNVASVTGPQMAMRDEPVYAAAKAAMVGLVRSVTVDYAAVGVTANAVAPGWIATGSQTDHERDQGRRTPVGRSATPDEVASAIAWLCTPGAAYVTGQCLVVDGGNSVSEERST